MKIYLLDVYFDKNALNPRVFMEIVMMIAKCAFHYHHCAIIILLSSFVIILLSSL